MDVQKESQAVLSELLSYQGPWRKYISDAPIPRPFRGSGDIRLVVLGQDPTVKNPEARRHITTVLNLDKPGSLRSYLQRICAGLGMRLDDHVYATNGIENFFTVPPTTVKEVDLLRLASRSWLVLLRREIAQFQDATLLSLGEPILPILAPCARTQKVRDYWGYTPSWKTGERGAFRYVTAEESTRGRPIFPFPHQPSIRKIFYAERLDDYLVFVKAQVERAV